MSNIFQVATKQSITEHVDYNHVHSNVNEKELRQLRLQCINYRCMVCADDFEIKSDLTTHMETEHRDALVGPVFKVVTIKLNETLDSNIISVSAG